MKTKSSAQRPFVFLNVATTADGKLAPANRHFVPFSSRRDQELLHELRTRAEKALGKKFDIREFHDEILTHGSVPLAVLEAAVDRWIAAKGKR